MSNLVGFQPGSVRWRARGNYVGRVGCRDIMLSLKSGFWGVVANSDHPAAGRFARPARPGLAGVRGRPPPTVDSAPRGPRNTVSEAPGSVARFWVARGSPRLSPPNSPSSGFRVAMTSPWGRWSCMSGSWVGTRCSGIVLCRARASARIRGREGFRDRRPARRRARLACAASASCLQRGVARGRLVRRRASARPATRIVTAVASCDVRFTLCMLSELVATALRLDDHQPLRGELMERVRVNRVATRSRTSGDADDRAVARAAAATRRTRCL